jgi:hypothetical protein
MSYVTTRRTRLGAIACAAPKTATTVGGRSVCVDPNGIITDIEGWQGMSNLEKALFQLTSPRMLATSEGMLWTGQCDPALWGFDSCEIARALVSPTTVKGSVYAAIASYIRYGFCNDTPEICAAAQAQLSQWRLGGSLFPATSSYGSTAVAAPAPAPAPVTVAPVVAAPVAVTAPAPATVAITSSLAPGAMAASGEPLIAPAPGELEPSSGFVSSAVGVASKPFTLPLWGLAALGLGALMLGRRGRR